ncbi:hypothetical protein [Roseivivax sp.]
MAAYTLTKTRFKDGRWQGEIAAEPADAPAPEVLVSLFDAPLRGAVLSPIDRPGRWALEVPVPPEALGDGVMTFLITEAASGARLGSFTMIGDEPLAEDIRAEVDLLRAELDMLKRAFRRHCTETG